MKIASDIDGVIAGFNEAMRLYLNEKMGRDVAYEDLTEYNFERVYGISSGEFYKHMRAWIDAGGLLELEPVTGASEGLWMLGSRNSIELITFRTKRFTGYDTRRWLKQNDITYDKLVFTNGHPKTRYINEVDIFIEDCAETASAVAATGVEVLLFDQPWNRKFNEKTVNRIRRVHDWGEIIEAVDGG